MLLLKGSTDFLHGEPQADEAGHLQIRVCDVSSRVFRRFDVLCDIGWPLPTKDRGDARRELSDDDASRAIARCVHETDVIRPPWNKLSAPGRLLCRFTEERPTPLDCREYPGIPIEINERWPQLEDAVAWA